MRKLARLNQWGVDGGVAAPHLTTHEEHITSLLTEQKDQEQL